ncbi:plasmid partitioning protein RepB C-terminal domain-containing protein [Trinickia violacea]|uniref:plasmid partitioning protein RepB C-terminal domain-containing protein n=1 Tax=Trinickia violacea TaxID=2571746 RepID=UPI002672A326|nr:plasmid partitioning protein RepB C-terminal domain-containing protein [Trinickia violacea]
MKRRAGLIDGICPEAAALLADKNCPGTTFTAIKLMKPIRQLEAAELMCGQGNFSSAFAKAIRAATPENLLKPQSATTHKSEDDLATQLAKLEKELATLQSNATQTDEQYGIDHLHLTVSATYISSLLTSDAVSGWLTEKYPEIAVEFQAIARGVAAPTEHKKAVRLQFKRRQHAAGPIN